MGLSKQRLLPQSRTPQAVQWQKVVGAGVPLEGRCGRRGPEGLGKV